MTCPKAASQAGLGWLEPVALSIAHGLSSGPTGQPDLRIGMPTAQALIRAQTAFARFPVRNYSPETSPCWSRQAAETTMCASTLATDIGSKAVTDMGLASITGQTSRTVGMPTVNFGDM